MMHYKRHNDGRPIDGERLVAAEFDVGMRRVQTHPTKVGYVNIKTASGWVLEHRYVLGQHLGRPLTSTESVHHINGDRGDNRIENLELWTKSQPSGQRVVDKLTWARKIVETYGDLLDRGLLAV